MLEFAKKNKLKPQTGEVIIAIFARFVYTHTHTLLPTY